VSGAPGAGGSGHGVNRQFPDGAREQAPSQMSANGGQPTAVAFMQAGDTLRIHQTFTSNNYPKGYADTARVTRTRKEACLWLKEWTCPLELTRALYVWITDYSEPYLRSALSYKPGSLNGKTTSATALPSPPLNNSGAVHTLHHAFLGIYSMVIQLYCQRAVHRCLLIIVSWRG
jgi:hypothetical protein